MQTGESMSIVVDGECFGEVQQLVPLVVSLLGLWSKFVLLWHSTRWVPWRRSHFQFTSSLDLWMRACYHNMILYLTLSNETMKRGKISEPEGVAHGSRLLARDCCNN